ncbi:hypothetical protein P0L94_03655 [Microbacter sp. GSS18]|nr:hypothetical protein P0L94_03655 [Microbacter sp. GSS18]
MDAPKLTAEQSRELDELRRRAYGGASESGLDARESSRLVELEDLVRAHASSRGDDDRVDDDRVDDDRVDVPSEPAAVAAASVRNDPAVSTDVATDGRAGSAVLSAPPAESESHSASTPHSTGDVPFAWLKRPRTTAQLALGVAVGIVVGVVLGMVLPSPTWSSPDISLATTDEEWAPQWESYLTNYEIVPETMQGYDRLFEVLMVWTADGVYGDRCLLVGHEPTLRITVETCTARDRYPTFDLIVTAQLRGVLDGAYAVGTTLRLEAREDAVDVRVLPPGAQERVAGA